MITAALFLFFLSAILTAAVVFPAVILRAAYLWWTLVHKAGQKSGNHDQRRTYLPH